MILADIRRYLEQRGRASLGDIALHLDSDPEAVRGMLDVWLRKGKVRKEVMTASCGGSCTKCASATTEIYAWVDARPVVCDFLPSFCEHR